MMRLTDGQRTSAPTWTPADVRDVHPEVPCQRVALQLATEIESL